MGTYPPLVSYLELSTMNMALCSCGYDDGVIKVIRNRTQTAVTRMRLNKPILLLFFYFLFYYLQPLKKIRVYFYAYLASSLSPQFVVCF